jgi:hypothetical protein
VKQRNEEADADEKVLRISMDAKATVKVGPFARGGKSRVLTKAADHDFEPVATVTPVGILLPASDELFLYGVRSKVTSDCLVDRLIDWWETVKERFSGITTLLIHLDKAEDDRLSEDAGHQVIDIAGAGDSDCPSKNVAEEQDEHDRLNRREDQFIGNAWNLYQMALCQDERVGERPIDGSTRLRLQ